VTKAQRRKNFLAWLKANNIDSASRFTHAVNSRLNAHALDYRTVQGLYDGRLPRLATRYVIGQAFPDCPLATEGKVPA
jgi:hypothetical protein